MKYRLVCRRRVLETMPFDKNGVHATGYEVAWKDGHPTASGRNVTWCDEYENDKQLYV